MASQYRISSEGSSNDNLLPFDETSDVESNDWKALEKPRATQHPNKRLRLLRIAKDIALYLLAFLGLAASISYFAAQRHAPQYNATYDANFTASYSTTPCNCGTSVTEARNLGCIYDELSAGWFPPHCLDTQLSAEFASLGDNPAGGWLYWVDKNHTQSLTLEEASLYADKQPENFHMSHEWHVQHCLFLWLKEHRMKARGMVYDPRSDSEHHIRHCMHILMTPANGTAAGATLIG
ncbi:hypothetical protein N0V90_007746 [Kalmusia sp. IMI 367209]|nr:hypothetical protein N0V90_007746 [Kalmusia sp. IMI 367209]